MDFETYVARRDYATFTGSIALSRASSWVSGDQSRRSHLLLGSDRSNRKIARTLIDLLGPPPSKPKYTLYDKVFKYSGIVYHYVGTLSKFFSIAFVADPEYQREVNYTFPKNSHIVNSVCRRGLIAIWLWSKVIQQILLPFFMVRTNLPATLFFICTNKSQC